MRQRADAEPTRRLTVTGSDTRLAASSDGPTLSARHLVAAAAGTMLLTVLALAPRPQLPPAVNRLWPSADRNAMLAALDKVNARVRRLGRGCHRAPHRPTSPALIWRNRAWCAGVAVAPSAGRAWQAINAKGFNELHYHAPTASPLPLMVCHSMIQPLVELYGGCVVVLKVS